jgi:protein phosphatase
MSPRAKLSIAALTTVGQVREENEDSLFIDAEQNLAVVCDGMGGHSGGKVASEMAVALVSDYLLHNNVSQTSEEQAVEIVQNAVFEANDLILRRARKDPELTDMGTTICVVTAIGPRALIAHVGDSRVYRLRGNNIEQMTRDHSLVEERIAAGLLLRESAEARMLANILTRALGMDEVAVDLTIDDMQVGDYFALTSDGITDLIEPLELLDLIQGAGDLPTACLHAIDLANARGGHDNATLVLVRVDEIPTTAAVGS